MLFSSQQSHYGTQLVSRWVATAGSVDSASVSSLRDAQWIRHCWRNHLQCIASTIKNYLKEDIELCNVIKILIYGRLTQSILSLSSCDKCIVDETDSAYFHFAFIKSVDDLQTSRINDLAFF